MSSRLPRRGTTPADGVAVAVAGDGAAARPLGAAGAVDVPGAAGLGAAVVPEKAPKEVLAIMTVSRLSAS